MIHFASVQTFYYKISRISVSFNDVYCFFVKLIGSKVFCNAAIVRITKFSFIIFVVKEVINIYIVNIALNVLQFFLTFLLFRQLFTRTFLIILLLLIRLLFILISSLFQPRVIQYFRYN